MHILLNKIDISSTLQKTFFQDNVCFTNKVILKSTIILALFQRISMFEGSICKIFFATRGR